MQVTTKLLAELHKKLLNYGIKKKKYKTGQKRRTNYE